MSPDGLSMEFVLCLPGPGTDRDGDADEITKGDRSRHGHAGESADGSTGGPRPASERDDADDP